MLLELQIDALDQPVQPRHFSIREQLSTPFDISAWVTTTNPALDLDALITKRVALRYRLATDDALPVRTYHGVCIGAEQQRTEASGITQYILRIGPRLSLLEERFNYRHFQHKSAIDIVREVLDPWGVEHEFRVGEDTYPALEMRIQYGESDLTFIERILSEAGISYYFEAGDDETRVVFDEGPQGRAPRPGTLSVIDSPTEARGAAFVSRLTYRRNLRAGRYRVRGHDPQRHHTFALSSESEGHEPHDPPLERYSYRPGAFVTEGHRGGDTPVADNLGVARADTEHGDRIATLGIERHNADRRVVTFHTNAFDLGAGRVITLGPHARSDLANRSYLIRQIVLDISDEDESTAHAEATFAEAPFRPRPSRPRRLAHGPVSAVVVGPDGEEIYTDEHGRVRVKFHWDRSDKSDPTSSAWLRVSDSWAGVGFGTVMLPRVGQEVLVGFLGGNPDEPIIIGRLYNRSNPHPYPLPENKTVSTWQSRSTPGGDGYNELRFEDKAGEEEVYLQAERNRVKLVKHDERMHIGRNQEIVVDGDWRKDVSGDGIDHTAGRHAVRIDESSTRRVGASEDHLSEGAMRHTVKESRHDVTSGAHLQRVGGDFHLKVGGNTSISIEGEESRINKNAFHRTVDGKYLLTVDGDITVKATGKIIVESDTNVCLKAGGSFIDISSAGIAAVGKLIRLNSGGAAAAGDDAEPTEPESAQAANVGASEP